MKTSVVILNWNGRNFLEKFLPAVLEHTTLPDTEIVVADNGSTDESVNYLHAHFPTVRLVVLDQNYGFAEGYNRALQHIQAEYYVLLNSDVEVTAGWLEPLVAQMDTHPNVAACQPKIKAYHNKPYFEHAGAAGGMIDMLGYPFCRGRIMHYTEQDHRQYDNVADVLWASGACLCVRAEVFHTVGGFDGEFFAHMEEIDLCWRLKSRAYDIQCIPQSTVYHVGGGTLHVESPRKTYLNFRNNLLMLYKNLPCKQLCWVMLVRLLMDYAATIPFLVSGKWANAQSVVRARFDFWKMRSAFKPKRRENLRLQTCHKVNGIVNRCIVWDYYVRGKRK